MTISTNKHTFLLILLILLAGCTKNAMSPQEYVSWYKSEKSPAKKEVSKANFQFTLQYQPAEYLALKELKDTVLTTRAYEKALKDYSGMYYFAFKISTKGETKDVLKEGIISQEEYFQRLQYFLVDAQHDLWLSNGKDSISCAFYHCERTYELLPYTILLAAFDKEPSFENKDLKFTYHDRTLGISSVSFNLSGSELKTPKVKI